MSRLPTAALTLAAVLAGRAAAKPPDLPLPQNDVLAPVVPVEVSRPAPPDLFPPEATPVAEPPLFFRVRPSVRRTMTSCLLFGANPLLALAPTDEYVDFDEEDVAEGNVPAWFDLFHWQQEEGLSVVSGRANSGADGDHFMWKREPQKLAQTGFDDAPSTGGSMEPCPSPSEFVTASCCPWMVQQRCAPVRPALLSADVDLSHDVLDNLNMLRQAHELLQDARELGRTGRTWEALESLQLAHDLCPNAWLDEKVRDASAEIFASSDSVSLQPCLPPVDPQVSEALDGLYPETSPPLRLASDEEEEPADEVVKGAAKPFVKADGLEDVGRVKDGGSPTSCLDVLRDFAALLPPEYGELLIGVDGGMRVFTQVRRGGAVWHLLYENGALSVWASPDGGADAAPPDENPPDDASGD